MAPPGAVTYAGWWRRRRRLVHRLRSSLIPFALPAIIALFAGPTEIVFKEDGAEGPGLYEQPTSGTVTLALLLYLAG